MTASLLSLPTELRLQIFEYLIAAKDQLHNPWLPVLLTNKYLHNEISYMLKDATLRLRISPRVFHQALAQNVRLDMLKYAEADDHPLLKIYNFRNYCKRFHEIVFDITETPSPTDCRIPPSYERKAKDLAVSLTTSLYLAIATDAEKTTSIEIKWGSFSRNVYRGIVTWNYCVLKGLGGLMAFRRSEELGLTEVLDCAIVLEGQRRRGQLPGTLLTETYDGSSEPGSALTRRLSVTEKIMAAMQRRASPAM